jgi:hypothetical protein
MKKLPSKEKQPAMNSQRNRISQYTLPGIALPAFSDESAVIPMTRSTASSGRTVSRQIQGKPEAPLGGQVL